jgi:ketosteroid isomerase-like protein
MTDMTCQAIVERMFSVEMAYLASSQKDLSMLAEAFSEDVVVREPPSLPYPGEWRGLDGLAALFARMSEVWSKVDVDGLLVTGSPDLVHLSCRLTLTSRATGRTAIQPFAEYLRFREGRLVEGIPFYHDTQELLGIINP